MDDERHIWIACLYRARGYVSAGYRPTFAYVATASGRLLAHALVREDEGPIALRVLLDEALANPPPGVQRPTRLEVYPAAAAAALAEVTHPEVVLEDDGGFHRMVANDQLWHLHDEALVYPSRAVVPAACEPDRVRDLFAAAGALAAADLLHEGTPLLAQLSAPSVGLHEACAWVGDDVVAHRGLLIFDTVQRYEAYARANVRYTHPFDPGVDQAYLGVAIETVTDAQRCACAALGVNLHDRHSMPRVEPHDADGIVCPVRPIDLLRATVAVGAVGALVPGLQGQGRFGAPARGATLVTVGSHRHPVEITVPHPEASPALLALSVCGDAD